MLCVVFVCVWCSECVSICSASPLHVSFVLKIVFVVVCVCGVVVMFVFACLNICVVPGSMYMCF